MPLTGNVIDVQKIQLTDTFQTWFAKTNEMVDALNPVNIYDIDDGAGTNVTYGLTGTAYNGVKYVNVNAGYGVGVGGGSAKPWTGVVGLDISSISGDAYTLTGNQAYTVTGGANILASEVNAYDWFVVQDLSDTTQGASGTTKKVQARNMLPREIYMPTLDFWGDLRVKGALTVVGAAASTTVGQLSIASQFVYLATTGSGSTAGAFSSDGTLSKSGVVIAMTGGIPNKEFVWDYNAVNSANSYWTINTNYGAKSASNALVNSKFIARDFVTSGTTANTFIFEAAGSTSTRLWLTENGLNPYFGIVKDTNSSNVNLNVYNGAGITSVAYIIAGATSQYTGVTANAFIQFANVDMVDGANATTGASAWTIPVSDQLGQLYPERHNAGQIKRRFTQASHGLTTGQAVAVIMQGAASGTPGTITGADANSTSTEAFGIVDRVISANEFSVTMKGYMDLASNGLFGIGRAITGQTYYLDWAVKGGLTTNTNVPQAKLYQPLFVALGASSGIVYGNEADVIFPYAQDQVYMRGMIPIGVIQPYAGGLAGLTMGLSGGSIPVSDVQYNDNWMPCDGRALSATGASGFVDLFNLINYTYSMRGVVQSPTGAADTVIRPDRGTSNLGSLGLGLLAGAVRVIKRTGTDSPNIVKTYSYTGLTADGTTITLKGLTTQNSNGIDSGVLVDILSPKDGSYFFAPDLRGKAPFGEYAPYGARGEGFSLTAGATGGTATGDGGLFTNYIIRAKRDSDAMILTGHNHDSRYLRKDTSDGVALAGSTLTLQNLEVQGAIGLTGNIGIGTTPLSWAAGYTGRALTVQRNGNFGTFVTVYNTDQTSTRALAGLALNNNVANGYVALYGNNASSHANMTSLENDSSGGGLLLYSGSQNGPIQFKLGGGIERMRIDAQGTVKFPKGLTYSSLTGSTPAKPTETIGLLNYDSTSGVMTLGSWSSGADAFMTFITTKGGTASERMRIDPAGNVGIGTSSPSSLLEVYGANTGVDGLVVRNSNGSAYANILAGGNNCVSVASTWPNNSFIFEGVPQSSGNTIISTYSNNLVFQTNGRTERMRIDSAGNVAIGDASSSQCRFNVYDSLAGSNGILAHFRNKKSDTGRSGVFLQITQANVQDWAIGQPPDTDAFTIYQGRNATAAGTERLRINSSGNVGIGTSTPTRTLDVNGSIGIASSGYLVQECPVSTGSWARGIMFSDGSGVDVGGLPGLTAAIGLYGTQNNASHLYMGFGGAWSSNIGLYVTRAGNVGIGTYGPNSLMNLQGNSPVLNIENADPTASSGGVLRFGHNQSSDRKPMAEIRGVLSDGSVNRTGALAFYTSSAGTLSQRMIVLGDGKVGIGISPTTNFHVSGDILASGNVTAYSDSRFKEDIKTLENALEKTKALNGVSYVDKETKERRIGLIAQEIKEVIPEVVSVNGDEHIHSVAYGNLVGLLIEAIKELNTKVDSLSAKVEQLSSKGSE
jgi:hypothetical protein